MASWIRIVSAITYIHCQLGFQFNLISIYTGYRMDLTIFELILFYFGLCATAATFVATAWCLHMWFGAFFVFASMPQKPLETCLLRLHSVCSLPSPSFPPLAMSSFNQSPTHLLSLSLPCLLYGQTELLKRVEQKCFANAELKLWVLCFRLFGQSGPYLFFPFRFWTLFLETLMDCYCWKEIKLQSLPIWSMVPTETITIAGA